LKYKNKKSPNDRTSSRQKIQIKKAPLLSLQPFIAKKRAFLSFLKTAKKL